MIKRLFGSDPLQFLRQIKYILQKKTFFSRRYKFFLIWITFWSFYTPNLFLKNIKYRENLIFLKQKSHRIDKIKHFFLEISNFWNFFAVLHCVLRTGTQCLENRNKMSWEQKHSILRTGTQCLENRNTVSWEQEHSFLRTGTTVSWEQEHSVLRTRTQCLENKNTMSWEQEHNEGKLTGQKQAST